MQTRFPISAIRSTLRSSPHSTDSREGSPSSPSSPSYFIYAPRYFLPEPEPRAVFAPGSYPVQPLPTGVRSVSCMHPDATTHSRICIPPSHPTTSPFAGPGPMKRGREEDEESRDGTPVPPVERPIPKRARQGDICAPSQFTDATTKC
jgi:hypothetical protein